MSTRRRPVSAGLAAGAAALVLGLAACSDDPEVPTASVGDCIESVTSGLVSELPIVDCDDPHEMQVVGVFEHDGDDFPGAEAIGAAAQEECTEAFEEFVGASFLETNLSILPLNPTQESWEDADDRETICLAARDDGADLTESVEDNAESFPLGG